jgi:pimeloyl-ACP methyl ester carboxylesterase
MAIDFKKSGSGPPLLLIHGFPMNRQVWEQFEASLSNQFTIFTPDLPGFGSSEILAEDFSLEDVAAAMNTWVSAQKIEDPVLIGHSLGGYVALEMVRLDPDRFKGLVLFHSTAYADSLEKKESRTKVLKFIDENGVRAFTSNFIGPLFADASHAAIPYVKDISVAAQTNAVKGYTKAMRDRTDNTRVLSDFAGPILLLGGEFDKGIPADSLEEQGRIRPGITVSILPGVAHMGMFEAKDDAIRRITEFLSGFITSKKTR